MDEEALKNFQKMFKDIKKTSENTLNSILTPEIMGNLSGAQTDFVNESKNAFNLNGKSLNQKQEQLNNLLKNVDSLIK